jgi:hypothetical protein
LSDELLPRGLAAFAAASYDRRAGFGGGSGGGACMLAGRWAMVEDAVGFFKDSSGVA